MTTENSVTTPPRQMASIKVDNLLINFTSEFRQVWDSTGSRSEPATFWHPTPAPDLLPGFFPLGDVIVPGHEDINGVKVVAVVREGDSPSEDPARGSALSRPNDYEQVWNDSGSGANKNCILWRPIPPDGYVALGLVCSMGPEKPSVHAVRCMRADLVIASYVGDLIWSEGRGLMHNFSAWGISLPAAKAGEIYFAPGTFVSDGSGSKPAGNLTYALRMKIQVRTNTAPVAPVISDFEAPTPPETSQATQAAMIPWFAVDQYPTSAFDDLSQLTHYRLERKDQYRLIGHGHNTADQSKLFKWTAPRTLSHEDVRIFSGITSIKFDTEWRAEASDTHRPIQFSAKLSKAFTRTETSSNGWETSNTVAVAAIVPKNKMLAVYQLASRYDLLSEDGEQEAISVVYADSDSLHWIEYPSATDTAP
ncbi:Vps62-related protein [Pseudomonas izuensis]|uniref:Vps62-related protein n=1 Tax=Pseudomonas izuensis TaxID=2684212 RepID=UPI0013594C97|nr:Vps62-related protein [Pseudomonas izuensis]